MSKTKRHYLKTWPEYYQAIMSGDKTFEVRFNDRDFKEGEILQLQEYDPAKLAYTGRQEWFYIRHILHGGQFGIEKGYVVMSISE